MIIHKIYTPQSIGFSFAVRNSLTRFERYRTLVHEHAYRVYTTVLGLQFALTPKCTQSKLGAFVPNMCVRESSEQ